MRPYPERFSFADPPDREERDDTVKGWGTGLQNSPQMGAIKLSLPVIRFVSCSVGELGRTVHFGPHGVNHLRLTMLAATRMPRATWQKLETGVKERAALPKYGESLPVILIPPPLWSRRRSWPHQPAGTPVVGLPSNR